MTSANITYYEIYHKDNLLEVVANHSQHCYCKNSIKDKLNEYVPPEDYFIQLNHPDEEENDHCSKLMNLKDYLDGKYRHTAWREEDGNLDDSHYCEEHDYEYLKKDCVMCLREKYIQSINELRRINQELKNYIDNEDVDLPQLTEESLLEFLGNNE
jgi:hypothetical protein